MGGPLAVRSLFAPWPGKPGRSLTVLGATAAAEYAAAVAGAAPCIEAWLGPDVHGGRVARLDPLQIEPWREALARHRRIAVEEAQRAGVALRLDVADCYRSIAPSRVGVVLQRAGTGPETIEAVLSFLGRTTAAGVPGLPVGPEPSAVLANAVLAELDRAAVDVGERVRCLRWFDDLLVLAPHAASLLAAETAIVATARRLGLRLNDRKRRLAVGPAGVRRLALGACASSGLALTGSEGPH